MIWIFLPGTQSGIGLSREEMVRIWLALRTLVESQPVEHVRFWGKILGTELNYVVAEVQWREGEGDDDEMEVCGFSNRNINQLIDRSITILLCAEKSTGELANLRRTVRFATKVNRAHEQVQFGSIWRTCICENNKIVIVIIMCSKLMFLYCMF